ncbi:MAG TPA: histidine kinase, partial [Acidimicrobiales bacterium]|nr:histidine kinase [Acidimicrobiales bacterium]
MPRRTTLTSAVAVNGDWLLATAAAVAMAISVGAVAHPLGERIGGVVLAAGLLVLVGRRRYPLAVTAIAGAVVLVEARLGGDATGAASWLALMVITYSLGAHARRRSLAVGLGLAMVIVVVGLRLSNGKFPGASDLLEFFFPVLVWVPAAVGAVVRSRASLADRLRAATARLDEAREERIAAALDVERSRLAQQVEDAVLRGFDALRDHPRLDTLAAVVEVEASARRILTEMRRLVVELRDVTEPAPPSPAVHLSQRVADALTADALPPTAASTPTRRRLLLLTSQEIDVALILLAAVWLVAMVVTTASTVGLRGPRWLDVVLAGSIALPLPLARRRPITAALATMVATLTFAAVTGPPSPERGLQPAGLLIAMPFAVAVRARRREALLGLGICLSGVALAGSLADVATSAVLVLATWGAGRILNARTVTLAALADTAIELEQERQTLARLSVAAERARVARDLHDSVAHAMTVIVLQAAAARRMWTVDPERAAAHVAVLGQSIDQALNELRPLAVSLALDNPGAGISATDMSVLVERAAAANLNVHLDLEADPPVWCAPV